MHNCSQNSIRVHSGAYEPPGALTQGYFSIQFHKGVTRTDSMVCIYLSKYRRSGHFHSKKYYRGLHKPQKKKNTKYILQRIISQQIFVHTVSQHS